MWEIFSRLPWLPERGLGPSAKGLGQAQIIVFCCTAVAACSGDVSHCQGIVSSCPQWRCHQNTAWFIKIPRSGHNKTPVCLPGASEFSCGASRSPWQLAHRASNVAPETLNTYTFCDFTLWYFELIRRRLPFVGHSKGEMVHRRKTSGQAL